MFQTFYFVILVLNVNKKKKPIHLKVTLHLNPLKMERIRFSKFNQADENENCKLQTLIYIFRKLLGLLIAVDH